MLPGRVEKEANWQETFLAVPSRPGKNRRKGIPPQPPTAPLPIAETLMEGGCLADMSGAIWL